MTYSATLDATLNPQAERLVRALTYEAYRLLPVRNMYAEVYLFYACRLLQGYAMTVEQVLDECRKEASDRDEFYQEHPERVPSEYWGAHKHVLQFIEKFLAAKQ